MAFLGFLGKVFGAKKRHDAQVHAQNVNSENAARDREFQKDMMRETNAHQIRLNRETHERNLELYERQRSDQASRLQTMVEDANAAGINPITALRGGASAASATPAPMEQVPILSHGSFTPTPLVTPDFANADMWEGIGEEADRWFQERRSRQHDEEMAQLQKEVLQEQIKGMKSRNSVATSPYFGLGMPHANTTARVDHGTPLSPSGNRVSSDRGNRAAHLEPDPIPLEVPAMGRNGQIVYVPNPELPDFDQFGVSILGGVSATVKEIAGNVRNAGSNAVNRVSSTFDRLRNWRPTTYHDLPPPPLSRSVPKGLRGDRARRRHPHYK
jgi:hypothetical protein